MNTGSYVNGKWYHPTSKKISRNINPADTSDVIAEFPLATAADVRTAIDAAVAAWPAWKKTPGPERGRVLWRAADIARRRVDEIAHTLTREEGKILKEAKGEVLKGISLLEYYAGEGFRMHGKTLPSESRDTFTYTLRQPLGVVGLIAPWNFPWAIPVWKSAPALVSGCCVVFKPAELTPATSILLADIYEQAGLPPGDRKSTRLNSSHSQISYAVFCLKKKKNKHRKHTQSRRHYSPRKLLEAPPPISNAPLLPLNTTLTPLRSIKNHKSLA